MHWSLRTMAADKRVPRVLTDALSDTLLVLQERASRKPYPFDVHRLRDRAQAIWEGPSSAQPIANMWRDILKLCVVGPARMPNAVSAILALMTSGQWDNSYCQFPFTMQGRRNPKTDPPSPEESTRLQTHAWGDVFERTYTDYACLDAALMDMSAPAPVWPDLPAPEPDLLNPPDRLRMAFGEVEGVARDAQTHIRFTEAWARWKARADRDSCNNHYARDSFHCVYHRAAELDGLYATLPRIKRDLGRTIHISPCHPFFEAVKPHLVELQTRLGELGRNKARFDEPKTHHSTRCATGFGLC